MEENKVIYCKNCGAELDGNAFFCNKCGTPTANSEKITPPAQPETQNIDPNISKKGYMKLCAPASIKKAVRNSAILCYICGGITVLASLLLNPLGIIDGLVFIGLGLGVHLTSNRACAIIALVVAVLEVVLTFVLSGTLTGWLWIIAGISCVIATNKAHKSYKSFKSGLVSNPNLHDFQ